MREHTGWCVLAAEHEGFCSPIPLGCPEGAACPDADTHPKAITYSSPGAEPCPPDCPDRGATYHTHGGATRVEITPPPAFSACPPCPSCGAGSATCYRPRIQTPCPTCGHRTLFIGDGGHLTCSVIGCEQPVVEQAIDDLKARAHAAITDEQLRAHQALDAATTGSVDDLVEELNRRIERNGARLRDAVAAIAKAARS